MQRREIILGSGTVAAASLLGYAGAATTDETADEEDGGRAAASSDPETVLELVPAESSLDASYQRLHYASVEDVDEDEISYEIEHALTDLEGVERDEVSAIVSAFSQDGAFRLTAVSGSFDRPEVGDDADGDDGWRVAALDGDRAVAAAENLLVAVSTVDTGRASGTEPVHDPIEIADAAADAARGEGETILVDPETTEPTFELLEDLGFVVFLPNAEILEQAGFDDEVESIGVGFEASPTESTGTTTIEYVLGLAANADVDDERAVNRLERLDQGEFLETSVARSDGFVHVEAIVDLPPERDREAAPDARIRGRSAADEGTVTFEHIDGESIDTDELELWLDGELADDQLADEYDAFAEGDRFELETGPLADVGLRWFDEAEDVYYYYDTVLVGRESFEVSRDSDAKTVTFTYVGELDADPARLEVAHRADGGYAFDRRPVEDVSGSLTAGDAITVEDVTLGDRVSIELASPANPNRATRSLARFHARPPRVRVRRRGGSVAARYYDEHERAADEFRVLVDDDPADVQFADVTETLASGDEVDLGDLDYGTTVVVEWLEPDDPVVVEETVIRPRSHIQLAYDDEAGTVTVRHRDGDAVAVDELELRFDGRPADAQPADEYETFEPGDELTIDVDPFTTVELVWAGPDDVEETLGHAITARDSIDAAYDADADEVELVYTGAQPADPDGLLVDHASGRSSESEERFAAAYDTLTAGDGIVLEDVDPDDRISVAVVRERGTRVSHRSFFRFSPRPRAAFHVDDRADGLYAVYREHTDRDAGNFEILVDGEAADVQPSDRYDMLTAGDEIELGEFDVGTELAIEWTVPDEPREITSHVVVPDAEFDVEYRADDGEVAIEHAGGDEIAAEDLSVVVEPVAHEPRSWGGSGTVSEGDGTTIDLEEGRESDHEPVVAAVLFRETDVIDHERIDD